MQSSVRLPSFVRSSLHADTCQGGFLAGLIIPHENGFAISFVEKLEDLVSIIFLPIVCPQRNFHTLWILTELILVLHTVGSQDQSRPARQRCHLGLRHHHLPRRLLLQVHCLCWRCIRHWLQMARSRCHRLTYEL